MPIYEYLCYNCNKQFEYKQKMTDNSFTMCSVCQCDTLIKLISASGFRLKGTGWYETDFKTKG